MKHVVLGRADGRSWTPLKVVARTVPLDRATRLSVTARGNTIEVRVDADGDPIISITDQTWTAGGAGVRMYTIDKERVAATFDDVRITPIPEQR